MTDTERSALLRCPLFARIAPSDVFALTECLGAAERRYERGEALWLTGDAVSACAVVLSGGVRAESLLPSGERSLTAVHGPGALVGDVLMATRDKKSPVDVIAAQNTAALFLPYRAKQPRRDFAPLHCCADGTPTVNVRPVPAAYSA